MHGYWRKIDNLWKNSMLNRLVHCKRFIKTLGTGIAFVCLVIGVPAVADEFRKEPLWEVILFTGAVSLPQYPASDENQFYAVPLPYLIYRGEVFKSTREGVRGVLFESDISEWTISLSGNPPVDNGNDAREDMAELDALAGVGPSVKLFLSDRNDPDRLYLQAAFRMMTSIDLKTIDISHEGYSGELALKYRNRSWLAGFGTRFGFGVDISFSDDRLNGYYYDVREKDVHEGRPAYNSSGGYSGIHFSANGSAEISKRISIGAYFRWSNYDQTVFEESPLVRDKNNLTIGCAVTMSLFRSNEIVVTYDDD